MSRIGNKHIDIPAGVEVKVEGNVISVKGPKGALDYEFNHEMKVMVDGNQIFVKRPSDDKDHRALHGTTRALIHNMVVGVSEGFTKVLEINGVGYKFQVAGNKLTISAGYSHPVIMEAPEGIKLDSPSQTELNISGYDKQAVGEFAALVRKVRGPEPYKGKGIKYADEVIRRKVGKTGKK